MCKYINKKRFTEREKEIILKHLQGESLNDLYEKYGMHRATISRLQKHIRECFPKLYKELEKKASQLEPIRDSFIMHFED